MCQWLACDECAICGVLLGVLSPSAQLVFRHSVQKSLQALQSLGCPGNGSNAPRAAARCVATCLQR